MAWNRQPSALQFRDTWRIWGTGGWGSSGGGSERGPSWEAPIAADRTDLPADRPPAPATTPTPVLWHQVARGESWAGLIARYNVRAPRALLEANGLQAPRPLVPGEWVCVPCDLIRPVWELDPIEEGDGAGGE